MIENALSFIFSPLKKNIFLVLLVIPIVCHFHYVLTAINIHLFIYSEESFPPAYVAWWAGTINRVVVKARQAGNRFLGPLKGLQIRAQYIQTGCSCGGGEGEGVLSCVVDHILQEFKTNSVSDQIQNLQNCYTTPNKNTSKDDILGIGVFIVPSSTVGELALK
jgi:hypothetical protein